MTGVTAPPTAFSSQQTVIEWTVTNNGTAATSTPTWYDAVWLSLDPTFDNADIFLGNAANPSYLDVGDGYNNSLTVTLPRGIDGELLLPGQGRLEQPGLRAPGRGGQLRRRRADGRRPDAAARPAGDVRQRPRRRPSPGQAMTLGWTVTNAGHGRTLESSWCDEVYMSADDGPRRGRPLPRAVLPQRGPRPGRGLHPRRRTVTLPVGVTGDYYFFVRTDVFDQVYEHAAESNNTGHDTAATRVNLTPPPDLEVESVGVPASATASHALTVSYRVTNFGSTATPNSSWTDTFYLSADTTLDTGTDLRLGTRAHFGALGLDGSYAASATFTLPDGLSGTYFVIVQTDSGNATSSWTTPTTSRASGTAIAITSRPADLVVSTSSAPVERRGGQGHPRRLDGRQPGDGRHRRDLLGRPRHRLHRRDPRQRRRHRVGQLRARRPAQPRPVLLPQRVDHPAVHPRRPVPPLRPSPTPTTTSTRGPTRATTPRRPSR